MICWQILIRHWNRFKEGGSTVYEEMDASYMGRGRPDDTVSGARQRSLLDTLCAAVSGTIRSRNMMITKLWKSVHIE